MTNQPLTIRPSESQGAKIRDVQALRGVCILLVVVQHFSLTHTLLGSLPWKFAPPFYVGVEIFFAISGFVVTNSLLHDDFSAARFFVKRVFRLLPASLCFLALTAVLNVLIGILPLPEHAIAMFTVPMSSFLRQAGGILGGYWTLLGENSYSNGAIWSLSIEDQFYGGMLGFCALVPLVLRCRPATIGRLLFALSSIVYLSVIGARLAFFLGADIALVPRAIHYLLFWRFDFIASGVALAFVERRFRHRLVASCSKAGPAIAALALISMLIVLGVCDSPSGTLRRGLDGLAMPTAGCLILLVVALAANGLAFPAKHWKIYSLLEKCGDRSYVYYLMHYPSFMVGWVLLYFIKPGVLGNPWKFGVLQVLLTPILLMPWCELVHRSIERPAMRLGRTIAGRIGSPRLPALGVVADQPSAGQPSVSQTGLRRAA
jgi:peptidoglycan/LPS O-acetylase OafA/YrhL